jgi:RNA polymerase sigma factor (TIGR02999 family)
MSDFTSVLQQAAGGDAQAGEKLLPLVYDELRRLAAARLAHEKPGQTLQATALVHEAYLRLVGGEQAHLWSSRNHFFAAAAEAMRRILVDSARRKATRKHGGDRDRQPRFDSDVAATAPSEEVIAVHEALDALQIKEPVAADLVKLHYFGGFSLEEAAELLGMSRATAYRTWTYARAWLASHLKDQDENP